MSLAFFIITVVAIGCATGLASDYLKTRRKELEQRGAAGEYDGKIQELEERIRVLERIVTESKHDLRREISEL
jgi:hypothetical protein